MATTKDVTRTPSGRIKYRGETFSGFNKPKRTPNKPKKSAVLAKKGSLKKARVVRSAPRVKLGQKELLTPTLLPMPTWLRQSIAKIPITPKAVKRKSNG